MTGSQNIDRILQLMCRVIRKHSENKPKLFVKVASMNNVDWMHDVMNATLCLFDEKWLMMYNGKNFLDMQIPTGTRKNIKSNINKKISRIKPTRSTPIDFIGRPVINFFNALYHKRDSTYATVEYTSLRDCVSRLGLYDVRKSPGFWTLERCKEDALKHQTKSEWQRKHGSGYSTARLNGWVDECCAHMIKLQKPGGFWTKERLLEDALKHQTKSEWRKINNSAYNSARNNGCFEECCSHMIQNRKPPGFWTLERCKEDALKHQNLSEWHRSSAYNAAHKNGWLEECCAHMIQDRKPGGFWDDKERVKADALNYKKIGKWQKNSGSAYNAARRNGWLDECCAHMK